MAMSNFEKRAVVNSNSSGFWLLATFPIWDSPIRDSDSS